MSAALEVKRPTLIWIAAPAGFVMGLYLLYSIIPDFAGQVGPWYRPFLALSGIATITSMIGMFNMKRWSMTLFIVYLTLSQLILLAYNVWNVSGLVPAIFLFVGFLYYDQMD